MLYFEKIPYKMCFFSGHRNITDKNKIESILISVIKEKISMGVTGFITGGAVGFDLLAAKTVLKLRKELGIGIGLYIYYPYNGYNKRFSYEDKQDWKIAESMAEEYKYCASHYFRGCYMVRNREMVDDALHGIIFCQQNSGGTYGTWKYAEKQNRYVINIADVYNGGKDLIKCEFQ